MNPPILDRRRLLTFLGGAGAGTLLPQQVVLAQGSTSMPTCVVVPRQTDGPYFLDERLQRQDIRSDPSDESSRPGLPLRLRLQLSTLAGEQCAPLQDAVVDLWQCDALGEYAGVEDRLYDTRGKRYLRGYQRSDSAGRVEFLTIYPGWYPSRAVHIHIKVRTQPDSPQGQEFATQLYFEDSLSDRVYQQAPYAGREARPTRNGNDRIFQRNGGEQLVLQVVENDEESGLEADFGFALSG